MQVGVQWRGRLGEYSPRPDAVPEKGTGLQLVPIPILSSLGIRGVKPAAREKPRVGRDRSLDSRQGLKAMLNMGLCLCLK